MSIFSNKIECERCGKKIRGATDGEPICEPCKEELALLMDSRREAQRSCPVDGAQMAKEIVHMIVADRCPQCRGVWLDGGELEKVYSSASERALTEMAKGLWIQMP